MTLAHHFDYFEVNNIHIFLLPEETSYTENTGYVSPSTNFTQFIFQFAKVRGFILLNKIKFKPLLYTRQNELLYHG